MILRWLFARCVACRRRMGFRERDSLVHWHCAEFTRVATVYAITSARRDQVSPRKRAPAREWVQ